MRISAQEHPVSWRIRRLDGDARARMGLLEIRFRNLRARAFPIQILVRLKRNDHCRAKSSLYPVTQ